MLFYYKELLERISRKFLLPQHFFFNSLILVWSQAASINGSSIGDTGCYHTTNTRINGDFITAFYGPVLQSLLMNSDFPMASWCQFGQSVCVRRLHANEEEMAQRLEGCQMHSQ